MLGVAVRLGSWTVAFQPTAVALLGDTDPHYHVLRAERWLRGDPGAPWRDPGMDWPLGADVFWPPLFDGIIAVGSWLLFGGDAVRDDVARVAAFLPVVLGAATLLVVAALGAAVLGRRRGWIAALLVALLPAHAAFTVVGRADHHAAELLFFPAVLLLYVRALGGRAPGTAAAGLAALLATAFWTWQGSAVLLAAPAALALVWYVAAPTEDPIRHGAVRALATAGLGAAALLVATLSLFGRDGAILHPAIGGVNGLSVAITLGAGTSAALLLALDRAGPRGRVRRAAEAGLAVALPMVLLAALSPALRAAVGRGATAMLRGSAWYGNIEEYRPLLFDGTTPLADDVAALLATCGLVLAAAAVPLCRVGRRWRRAGERPGIALLAISLAVFTVAAFGRRRFVGYMVVAAAVPAEAGIRTAAALVVARARGLRPAARALPLVLAIAVVAPCLRFDVRGVGPLSGEVVTAIETLSAARSFTPAPGREAVLAPWELGHLVQYYWGRPVVVTPFGIEGGAGAFEAWAAFFFETDPARAEAALAARRVAFVVLDEPSNAADKLRGLAPPGAPAYFAGTEDLWIGAVADVTPAYWTLVAATLYHGDGCGGGPARRDPLPGFRLVLESRRGQADGTRRDPMYKVFGVVPGAAVVVRGAPPGGSVEASAHVRTNLGRRFSISFESPVDSSGSARLRLPYASGWNGLAWAEGWLVTDGNVLASLTLDEADVVEGRTVELTLPRTAPASPHGAPTAAAASPR